MSMHINKVLEKQAKQEDYYSKLITKEIKEIILRVGFRNKKKVKKAIRKRLKKLIPNMIKANTTLGLEWLEKNGFNPTA